MLEDKQFCINHMYWNIIYDMVYYKMCISLWYVQNVFRMLMKTVNSALRECNRLNISPIKILYKIRPCKTTVPANKCSILLYSKDGLLKTKIGQ